MAEINGSSRRERILSAATEEFAQQGFAGARMERIAASAGVNKQLVFHYFESKRGLHRAALNSVLARHALTDLPGKQPADRLRGLIAQLAALSRAHPSVLALLASSRPGSASAPESQKMAKDWRAAAVLQARRILEEGQRAGYFRDDLDLDDVSEVVVAASLARPASADRSTAAETDGYLDTLLRMAADYCTWR